MSGVVPSFMKDVSLPITPVSPGHVILLSTKFPLVLRFQLNKQQKLMPVRVSGTDSTVKCGIVTVQIVGEIL